MEFLQDRDNLTLQLEDSWQLLHLGFLIDLTAILNELNTELHVQNKTTIEMIGTIDSFKRKLNLWKTQQMKGVLTHFPCIQSRADGTFDLSVYILCIQKY
jgi:hypothetical protein